MIENPSSRIIDNNLRLELISYLKKLTNEQGTDYHGEFYFCAFCHSGNHLNDPGLDLNNLKPIKHQELCSGINWLTQLENLEVYDLLALSDWLNN